MSVALPRASWTSSFRGSLVVLTLVPVIFSPVFFAFSSLITLILTLFSLFFLSFPFIITFPFVIRRMGGYFPLWRPRKALLGLMTWLKDFVVARSLTDWRLFTHCFSRHLFTYKWWSNLRTYLTDLYKSAD